MKNAIRKFLFFLVSFILSGSAFAQNHSISVTAMPGFPDTALYNQIYSFSAILYCDTSSSASYTGTIYILCHTNTSNVSQPDTLGHSNQVSIDPGFYDTVTISGTNFSDTSAFKMGGNVVVVWPVSGGGNLITAPDSFYTNLTILGYSGIPDVVINNDDQNIYPVPANDEIFLPPTPGEPNIEHVRIFDVTGRTKIFIREYPKYISVAELENGLYFIEVREKNNQARIFKFIVLK